MDFNEKDFEPVNNTIPSDDIPADDIPANEIPVSEIPADEAREDEPVADPSTGIYRGAGVGQKESPFASSPYYTQWEQPQQEAPQYEAPKTRYTYQEVPKREKKKKQRKPLNKRLIAAGVAAVLVAGSCGVTAGLVNSRWERETEAMAQEFNEKLQQLEGKVGSASVISGSPVAAGEALSPSQVYAMNVNSVVSITNTGYQTVSGWGQQYTQEVVGSGSGFIISEDGYIVSNYHVIEGASKLVVTTYLGDEYEATVVGSDSLNDVALLKVEATGLDAVDIGSSDDLNVGDQVVAIGNPLGELTSTQPVGYVGGKDRSVTTDGTIINMLQTDAAINSGNSGGPLFNMAGQVIGITTAKYSGDSGSGASIEGIGFAIPIDDVMGMIDDFKQYGYLRNQAYLGVSVVDMDSGTASAYSLPSGAYVLDVTAGSSAEKAGVQVKDIIIGVGDYEVTSRSELTTTLRKFSAGDTTTITVYRAGQELDLSITFDEKPEDTSSTEPTTSGEMPQNGSYEEWYDYFFPYGGSGSYGGGYGG